MKKQPAGQKTFYWRGRNWTIIRVDNSDPLRTGDPAYATVDSEAATIYLRSGVSRQLQMIAIIHELGHEMFPEWKTEPADSSASELGVFERDLPAALVALGVDLSPLVDW